MRPLGSSRHGNNYQPPGSEDIGMGYTKSFGVLSRHAGQETGPTAFVRCERSHQRGPEKVSKSIPNLSAHSLTLRRAYRKA